MNKSILYRIATICVPLLCCVMSMAVILYERHRQQKFGDELAVTTKQVDIMEQLLKESANQPRLAVALAAGQTPQEQTNFLNTLRAYAAASGVKIIHWNNSASTAPTGASAEEAQKKAATSEVTAIGNSIEIAGEYNNVRSFLYRVLNAPRLLNMNDMVWARDKNWPMTFLKFNITRYVAPPNNAIVREFADPAATQDGQGIPPASAPAPANINTTAPASASATTKTAQLFPPANNAPETGKP